MASCYTVGSVTLFLPIPFVTHTKSTDSICLAVKWLRMVVQGYLKVSIRKPWQREGSNTIFTNLKQHHMGTVLYMC